MNQLIDFEEALDLIADPVSKQPLEYLDGYLLNKVTQCKFPIDHNKSPILFPSEIIPFCKRDGLDWVALVNTKQALKQYFGMAYIKWDGGTHNSSPDDECYKQYLESFRDLVSDASGMVLDIGCDDPANTITRFPKDVRYLGIDPLYYLPSNMFKIFAVSEFLPFKSQQFDNVCFGTSLDHAMDTNATLDEACRVLVENGNLYLTTLVWHENAELYNDSVHFHHFRESHIVRATASKSLV